MRFNEYCTLSSWKFQRNCQSLVAISRDPFGYKISRYFKSSRWHQEIDTFGRNVSQRSLSLRMPRTWAQARSQTISSPEAALLLVSTKKSRPLARSNTGSPRFTDFPSLCACSESSLTNLIGSGFNLLCSQSHSKTECRWTSPEGGPEVAILGADQKERGFWREW